MLVNEYHNKLHYGYVLLYRQTLRSGDNHFTPALLGFYIILYNFYRWEWFVPFRSSVLFVSCFWNFALFSQIDIKKRGGGLNFYIESMLRVAQVWMAPLHTFVIWIKINDNWSIHELGSHCRSHESKQNIFVVLE